MIRRIALCLTGSLVLSLAACGAAGEIIDSADSSDMEASE